MTTDQDPRADEWRYAEKAMTWYGWGSPVGLGLGIALILLSTGGFLVLLHIAGLLR